MNEERYHLQLISIMGGLSGVTNCLSRLRTWTITKHSNYYISTSHNLRCIVVGGILVDYLQFRVVMPVLGLLLTIIFLSLFFVSQHSFFAWMLMFWLINLLGFAHFAVIPATVIFG